MAQVHAGQTLAVEDYTAPGVLGWAGCYHHHSRFGSFVSFGFCWLNVWWSLDSLMPGGYSSFEFCFNNGLIMISFLFGDFDEADCAAAFRTAFRAFSGNAFAQQILLIQATMHLLNPFIFFTFLYAHGLLQGSVAVI